MPALAARVQGMTGQRRQRCARREATGIDPPDERRPRDCGVLADHATRRQSGLSQAQFAALMGVSVRTLQEWEQGRRQPSGAAKTLLKVAERHPEVLRELAAA